MKNYPQLVRQFLSLKERLPQNGDWLFVTESTPEGQLLDAAEGYREPTAVLTKFSGAASIEVTKAIYERAKLFEIAVGEIANRTYDKSKVLFGAASFASTILLALSSILLPPMFAGPLWLGIAGAALSLLLIFHLGRALIIAASVMTREVLVRETPDELLELSTKEESEVYRELMAKVMSYSIQTQTYGLAKLNRLIIAQTSFKYGLVYYFILAALSGIAHFGGEGLERSTVRSLEEDNKLLRRSVEAVKLSERSLSDSLEHLRHEQMSSLQELRISSDLKKSELGVLREIEATLSKAHESPPPAPRGKRP